MKFLVLCSFQLRRADERALHAALEILAAAGFKPVHHAPGLDDHLRPGVPRCMLGEFRAPAADALTRRIESDLRLHFAGRGLDAEFNLRLQPLREEPARGSVAG
jgi:hypothetical protein